MMTQDSTQDVTNLPAIPEVTVQSVALGLALAAVFTAATTYLGLYTGIPVAASLPATVMAISILRGLFRQGTVLENNIVGTIASSGQAVAAGLLLALPAMLITGVWSDVPFWPSLLIALSGGLLGVALAVPLRRPQVVEDPNLTFPEGVGCAEILKAGERGDIGLKVLMPALALGAVFKLLTTGWALLRQTVESSWLVGKSALYLGGELSPALLGVGYLAGPRLASLVFAGSFTTWMFAIPFFSSTSPAGDVSGWFWSAWKSEMGYLGVGALLMGGAWEMLSHRDAIWSGLVRAFGKAGEVPAERTDRDIAAPHLILLIAIGTAITFGMAQFFLGSAFLSLLATLLVTVMSFFFVSLGVNVVGHVGVSFSPLSAIGVGAALTTGGLFLLFGIPPETAVLATLSVAGVVCCAVRMAGGLSQDLKTGHLVGATPARQQWMEVLGIAVPALLTAPVLGLLHHAYGIGTGQPQSLKAPGATLLAGLVQALFSGGALPWKFLLAGAALGLVVIAADGTLKARGKKTRLPVTAFAVGMYLPFSIAVPLFIGGLLAMRTRETRGTLFASGLIAGEALAGVWIAASLCWRREVIAPFAGSAPWMALLAFAMVVAALGASAHLRVGRSQR